MDGKSSHLDDLRIVPMSQEDLVIVSEWAASEGWNPGLEDAAVFFATDPRGFWMGVVKNEPVAAISIVRHSPLFAFVGFYICRPAWRGRGYGYALWRAVFAASIQPNMTIGLDGVVAQQANYEKSGFRFAHLTQRYEGNVDAGSMLISAKTRVVDMARDEQALQELDRRIQGGLSREAFVKHWFQNSATRQTLVLQNQSDTGETIAAVGTIRQCQNESYKIGPLFAPDEDTAEALLESLVSTVATKSKTKRGKQKLKIILDVPDPNHAGVALAGRWGLTPAFACGRMYMGDPPERDLSQIFGESTFELG